MSQVPRLSYRVYGVVGITDIEGTNSNFATQVQVVDSIDSPHDYKRMKDVTRLLTEKTLNAQDYFLVPTGSGRI